MTEDEGRIFMEYTVLAMVRCIWTNKPDIHHNRGQVQFIKRKFWPSIIILPERFPAVWMKYVVPVSLNYRLVYVT